MCPKRSQSSHGQFCRGCEVHTSLKKIPRFGEKERRGGKRCRWEKRGARRRSEERVWWVWCVWRSVVFPGGALLRWSVSADAVRPGPRLRCPNLSRGLTDTLESSPAEKIGKARGLCPLLQHETFVKILTTRTNFFMIPPQSWWTTQKLGNNHN